MITKQTTSSLRARQALLKVLGVDLAGLKVRDRATMEALSEEVLALRDEVDALQEALARAESLADIDGLCPVFNRRAFEREIRREIALAGRFRTRLSLIFLDLDNFKQVNDAYGHGAGDNVLVKVAELLSRNTRETDVVGRLGGDEFGVVLTHASLADAEAKAKQLEDVIDSYVMSPPEGEDGPEIILGASCGVVEWRAGQDANMLISNADKEMFSRKARRKRA